MAKSLSQLQNKKLEKFQKTKKTSRKPKKQYSRTGKVRLMAKNIGFRMELLGTPKVRLGVPA